MVYKSPFEAYPFLRDPASDLRCDFEILTDKMASATGLLRSLVEDECLREELQWVGELIYHANPTLRTHLSIEKNEIQRLAALVQSMQEERLALETPFVLPQGCTAACVAHIVRTMGKEAARLVYRYIEQGGAAPDELLDILNLLSGYFFLLSLKLNVLYGEEEVAYQSRNYGHHG